MARRHASGNPNVAEQLLQPRSRELTASRSKEQRPALAARFPVADPVASHLATGTRPEAQLPRLVALAGDDDQVAGRHVVVLDLEGAQLRRAQADVEQDRDDRPVTLGTRVVAGVTQRPARRASSPSSNGSGCSEANFGARTFAIGDVSMYSWSTSQL